MGVAARLQHGLRYTRRPEGVCGSPRKYCETRDTSKSSVNLETTFLQRQLKAMIHAALI